ncbi:hypothetical protein G647_09202, partial [Cladophialophora carrionii CBS 160.54]
LSSTWRGLLPSIEDSPLAVCDYRSIADGDLIAADKVTPSRVGEVYYLKHNDDQAWYWCEGMSPEDMWTFVVYDSAGKACCPHTAFLDPRAETSAPPRRSIETRSIVITKDDERC